MRTKVLGVGLIMPLGVNIVLMLLVKIGVGRVGNSYALVADGIESAKRCLLVVGIKELLSRKILVAGGAVPKSGRICIRPGVRLR
ncbi:MAG TPA: hypothetical protein VIS96_18620 [Terrimicrobiaceae bacterium]